MHAGGRVPWAVHTLPSATCCAARSTFQSHASNTPTLTASVTHFTFTMPPTQSQHWLDDTSREKTYR